MSHGTPTGEGPVVRVRDLEVHFSLRGGFLGQVLGTQRVVRAVDGVSLDVARGETLGLVGESGSGKTTLGRAVLRLVEPTAGTVEFEGRDITRLRERDLRPLRRRMQPVFQDPHAALNPAMTIGEAVAHPLRIQGLCATAEEARTRAAAMLDRVGVTPAATYLDRFPEDLSGGQKQRVVIARALITEPALVVADEPVAMLDMSVRALVLRLLARLKRDLGLTYVFITHDLATARLLCERVAVMYLGKVVETGPAAEVLGRPRHPYTRALLEAVPRPDPAARDRPRQLPPGEVPDATDPPTGCRFHPRCPAAFAPCPDIEPRLINGVACHLYGNPTDMDNDTDRDKNVIEKLADKVRGTGVGTEDPNIKNDAAEVDVPPGEDPDTNWPPREEGVTES
jgi:oligopeptide/dipeptide ABC transporter ATP-binding protein